MLRIALLASAVALVGCERQEVSELAQSCEDAIKLTIRTPSTYQFIWKEERTSSRAVRIAFDSQNVFGAVIRSSATCLFDEDMSLGIFMIDGKSMKVD